MRHLLLAILLLIIPMAHASEHVVVVVWDGLRPDSVTEADTPTLAKLAKSGVFFANHHAVFLSSTVVNGTALATGCYPARNGTLANAEYRPKLNATTPVSTAEPEIARTIAVPTLAEIIQQAGKRTAIVGAKSVALVHDHKPRGEDTGCYNIIEGHDSLPPSVIKRLIGNMNVCPGDTNQKDDWCTRALTGLLWDDGLPAYSLLWLAQPDAAQHNTGLGSDASKKALRNSDNNLARLLDELDARGRRADTDIIIVSDHGFSTIAHTVDLPGVLQRAGFKAGREFANPPADGQVLVVNNGTASLLYVAGHKPDVVQQLVQFLQQQDFTGVILTREPHAGTFTLDQARVNTPGAPDIIVSFRWTEDRSTTGLPGMIYADAGARGVGQGAHGSLSRYDMHNTLIAAGPDFQKGMTNNLPSSNADVAPTVLNLLRVPAPEKMDGRVLSEAFVNPPAIGAVPHTETLEAITGHWRQYLRVTSWGGSIYFDEGNSGTK
jgi:arylsulfatase A-like enzyme